MPSTNKVSSRACGFSLAKEITLADRSKKDDAQVQFKKLQKAEDGKKAMSEYESERAAVLAKTARLRALRLAREEAEQASTTAAPSGKKKPAKKSPKAKSSDLADWLKTQRASGRRS